MADRLRVPPGRAGRLWLRGRLTGAERAVTLLDRKLRILRAEQEHYRLLVEQSRRRWREAQRPAERWLLRATLLGGQREILLAAPVDVARVDLRWQDVMGVRYPAQAHCVPGEPAAIQRPAGSAAVLRAAAAYRESLLAGVECAAAESAAALVDAEVEATRRRLRAISDRWVPRLRAALHDLDQRLEEDERAEAVRLRWAARRIGSPGAAP